MKDKVIFIGFHKLDKEDYGGKIRQIIENNNLPSINIISMKVPCCNGLL